MQCEECKNFTWWKVTNIPEAFKIRMPSYSRHAVVVCMVSMSVDTIGTTVVSFQ